VTQVPRRYQSVRRGQDAAKTRQDIVVAAIRLHGDGVTDFGSVAEAAGVALPTVYKYFPSKEDLYRACTTHMPTTVPPPSIDELLRISDPIARLRQTVRQVYQLHEARLGQSWNAYRHQSESPALAQALAGLHGFVSQVVEMLIREAKPVDPMEREANAAFARGLLSPLGYRTLRVIGGLSPEVAAEQSTRSLACMLWHGNPRDGKPRRRKK